MSVYQFLVGLNRALDDVRSRILSRKPLPTTREVFSEIRREENRRHVMMKEPTRTGSNGVEVSVLLSKGPRTGSGPNHSSQLGPNQSRGRPRCDHCRKPGYVKEKCWALHGKPADWKPKHIGQHQIQNHSGYQASIDQPKIT